MIADVNRSKGEATAEEIGNCLFVQCDVTDPEDWERLWEEASDFFDERGVQVGKCLTPRVLTVTTSHALFFT